LGLISREDTLTEIEAIFASLPTIDIDGLALPPALFNGANGSPVLIGYDACDIGRFLSAMKNLVTKDIISFSDAEAVLARWDLAATVRERKVFGHRDQRWSEMTQNHCATYSAKAFAFFGLEIDPAIDALDAQSNADARLAVMYQADDIGHYGAEPYLLEAIEGSMTPQSQLLTEVLLAAQMQWFEDTGQLKCVSEAPLNFAPWFSFQGLRLGRSGAESWVISTPDNAETAPSAVLTSRAAMISAKAAYLWDATYPGAYASRLVETIRQSARLADGGFSVGVLERDGSALADYSDINTNGIILQAIAHKLTQS
jgi:hypothetical protein